MLVGSVQKAPPAHTVTEISAKETTNVQRQATLSSPLLPVATEDGPQVRRCCCADRRRSCSLLDVVRIIVLVLTGGRQHLSTTSLPRGHFPIQSWYEIASVDVLHVNSKLVAALPITAQLDLLGAGIRWRTQPRQNTGCRRNFAPLGGWEILLTVNRRLAIKHMRTYQ